MLKLTIEESNEVIEALEHYITHIWDTSVGNKYPKKREDKLRAIIAKIQTTEEYLKEAGVIECK